MPPIWGLFNLYTMLNVKLGEVKTQTKPFPKLMFCEDSLVEVYEFEDSRTGYAAIHRRGYHSGKLINHFHLDGLTDYNEPITIQNA